MTLHLGLKSDPIEHRYSFDWLFGFMAEHGIQRLQLGSFFALYELEDEWLLSLARRAERRGVRIASVFTSHRELGGFMTGDASLERVTRRMWERMIRAAALVGAASAGASIGYVLRDRPGTREAGLACLVRHMKELSQFARTQGLSALTVEPMSSTFEFPSTLEEVGWLADTFAAWEAEQGSAVVPLLWCGDTSHGVANADGRVTDDNMVLLDRELPRLWEFHFKNTDERFNATFGFSAAECARGIVDPARVVALLRERASSLPVAELTGYLEHPGPKLGRDYSDPLVERMLAESIETLKAAVGP